MAPQEVNILIIGAGLIGSSVAMHLARFGLDGIRVVDFDLEGSLSSSELNAGGVRATWNQPINILASKISIDYFQSVAERVGYRDCGYLWLHGADRFSAALKAREQQVRLGWPVEVWEVSELRRRVPFIDKTNDLAGALFGSRDGLINPNLLKSHFREIARAHGVQFEDRVLARGASYETGGVRVDCERFESPVAHETKVEVLSGNASVWEKAIRTAVSYRAKTVVNCAGPWAPEIAKILRYPCPSFPVRRQVSIFDCRDVDLTPYGMMIDPTGVYFHPEASNGLAGIANKDETHGINYRYDGESFFTEIIWPALYERSSKFERLRHLTGWAGQYEVSPDESAIVGPVELGDAGRSGRVFEAHSFSGHGAMHSYAAGLVLAEKMTRGRYETLDFSELSGTRFETGRLLRETAVI